VPQNRDQGLVFNGIVNSGTVAVYIQDRVSPQRHSGGGGPAPKAATRVAASTPPKHLDIFKGAPLWLPKALSDQFPVHVCSCPLCFLNRLCTIQDGCLKRTVISLGSEATQTSHFVCLVCVQFRTAS